MPHSRFIWSGTVSFGLVSIPVGLLPAVREGRIEFHMLHKEDNARLERRMVCPADGRVIPPEHMLRGVEVSPGAYVAFTEQELDAIAPKESQSVEITDFVDEDDVDPIFYDRTYYLMPGKGGAKPYRLLTNALKRTRKAGIAMFVLRAREHPVTIRVVDDTLCLSTLHFPKEIVSPAGIAPENGKVRADHVRAILKVIERMKTKFEPAKYSDAYRERLMAFLQSKLESRKVVEVPQTELEESGAEAEALMKALKKSLKQTGKRKSRTTDRSSDGRTSHPRRKKTEAHQSRKSSVSRRRDHQG